MDQRDVEELDGLLRPDGSVVVPAHLAGELLAAAVRDLTARARRDATLVSPPALRVLQALHQAAVRHDERPSGSAAGTPEGEPSRVEVSTGQAAMVMGCSASYMRRLCRSGAVSARRIGTAWLIDSASLDAHRYGPEGP